MRLTGRYRIDVPSADVERKFKEKAKSLRKEQTNIELCTTQHL